MKAPVLTPLRKGLGTLRPLFGLWAVSPMTLLTSELSGGSFFEYIKTWCRERESNPHEVALIGF
jgi:hypothetical protein